MKTLEEAIERFSGCCMFVTNQKETCEQLAAWLRELQERRKQPELICCGECGHSMYDEDGEMYCNNPNTDVYYTHYDFACNRSERRTDE